MPSATHQSELKLLRLIYDTTCRGEMTWSEPDDGHFKSNAPEGYPFPISFQFKGVESHPNPFTSRAFIDLSMPGLNGRYFAGTEGYAILFSLMCHIANEEALHGCDDAVDRFVAAFPQPKQTGG